MGQTTQLFVMPLLRLMEPDLMLSRRGCLTCCFFCAEVFLGRNREKKKLMTGFIFQTGESSEMKKNVV
jgi:hypothetical protein